MRLSKAAMLLGLGILLIFIGCKSAKKPASDPFFEKWRTKAETSQGYSPPAQKAKSNRAPVASVLKPDSSHTPAPIKQLPQQKVTMKLSDAPLSTALRSLAKIAGQSMLISNTVEGAVNINVVSEPWESVFLGIMSTYGLTYEWAGNILKIKTHEDLSKEWETEKAELQQKELRWKLKHVEDLKTQIFFIRYADAEALGELLNNLNEGKQQPVSMEASGRLEISNPQSITVDKFNNAIIAHGTADRIQELAGVIEKLDRPIPQIAIEAQIVETNRDTARALGVQWGGLTFEKDGSQLHWLGGPTGTYDGSLFTETQGDNAGGAPIVHQPPIGNIVNFPAALDAGTGLTLGYQLQDLSRNYLLNFQLSALQEEGKLNILSTPSITTLNNQVASIESGREVPYQTVEDDEVKIEFKKAVLSLKVTPHVIDENTLKLNIVTHKDELDFTNAVQGNPTIITKNAETNVILFDGQTMVIGGLSKETSSANESGVMGLKDLPGIGRLFKGTSKDSNMEEVLIFITPYILKEKPSEADAAAGKPSGSGS